MSFVTILPALQGCVFLRFHFAARVRLQKFFLLTNMTSTYAKLAELWPS